MLEDEYRLRQDLPRGHAQQPKSSGRERPLFARWLTPAEIVGPQWCTLGGPSSLDWSEQAIKRRLTRRSLLNAGTYTDYLASV